METQDSEMETQDSEKEICYVDDAEIIGIGIYSEDIAPHLDYPEKYYKNFEPGMPILCVMFRMLGTDAEEFCDCVGITNATDLSQTLIKYENVKEDKLKEWAKKLNFSEGEINDFLFLLKHPDWKLFYYPELC